MLFNRQGLQQKNWRMVKKGKHILFGCSLFFVVGAVNISGPQVTYAGDINGLETVSKQEKNSSVGEENLNATIPTLEKEKQTQSSGNKSTEKITASETVGVFIDKKELEDLVAKIKKADISKKTEKSAEKLNLILSRAEKTLEDLEINQEEIDNEVKALKEAFDNLEDKPKEDKKSEAKEKVESKKEEKSNVEKNTKEKHQENTTEDVARKHNEKITKVIETVTEIHSIANQINYEFSDAEKEVVKTAENLSTARNSDKNNEETIQKLLNEVIYLRNRVANRMTRAHSGKRDPRNGKPIENNGESTFRGIRFTPLENIQNGKVVSNADTNLTYFNSDSFWIKTQVTGEKFRHDSANTYYLVKKVTLSGKPFKDLSIIVSTGKGDRQASTTIDNINNPNVQAGVLGNLGTNGIIKPGNYQVVLTVNDTVSPGNNYNIIYNITIKPQSERNTVNNLTPTYVDDVRHLTETEKNGLIEKFKTEHPNVVNRANHIDFNHAEVSADGATMTIHFKDGFAPKTIQTNAQNDAIAKHQSITALYGDPHDFYKNPRNLVKSKTNHEVPETARVTWKTPFDLSQPGTKNAVVTVSYDNGVTKDVTTPYTVLDFIGKQDKRINQHQSGELGDARSYITLSNGTAPATDLTIRWKGGSTVDTSRSTVHRKQIEILRGNTVMKTVDIPVEIVDNIRPTVEIPYDNPGNQEIYLYSHENNNITLKAKDNNGKISKVYLAFPADNRQGLGQEDSSYLGGGSPDGLYLTATKIKSETTGSDAQPATITVSGNINNQQFTNEKSITRYLYAEDPAGNSNYEHVGHANDTRALGRVRFVWKPQTFKYTATANSQTQTLSHRDEPSAEASINKTGLPTGTTYAWKTKPNTSSPGNKSGVVEVTYPDNSKDTVNVTVSVRKLSDEYAPTGNKIVRNQNGSVTNNDLKAAVTISNNGNSKVKSVTPVGTISTAEYGNKIINATVTYLDDTTDTVTIPLEVRDVTKPTIQTSSDRQNWDLIALDRTLPEIKVTSIDNSGGSGVKSTTVTGLPNFLTYDETTKTIKFKNGVQEVTKLPVGTNEQSYNVTIQVTDNANNSNSTQVTITVKSMMTKFNPTPLPQTVDNGTVPEAEASVDKKNAPSGTTVRWKETPEVTTPGAHKGVAIVHYPDGSEEEVDVPITVKPQKDTYDPVGKPQTVDNGTVPEAEASVDKKNAPSGTTVRWKETPEVTTPGAHKGVAIVHYPDGSEEEVDVPVVLRHSNEKGIPEVQSALPEFAGGVNGDPEAQSMLPEFNGGVNGDPEAQPMLPEFVRGVNGEPEAQPMLPEFNGGVNGDPEVQSTLPEFAGGVNGEPEAQPELSEYTGGVNGEPEAHPTLSEFVGGVNGDPEVQPVLPEFAGGVNGDPEVQLALLEFSGGVNGDPEAHPTLPEFNGGVNGDPEVHPMLPEFNGGVNGESEAQPTLPEFNGGVNGDSEVQPTLPEYTGGVNGEPEAQPSLPEFVGGVNGEPEVQPALPEYAGGANDKSEIRSSFRDKTSNVATKRLANTGQSQNNSELAGLGLMIVGLFAAIKRRKNEEE